MQAVEAGQGWNSEGTLRKLLNSQDDAWSLIVTHLSGNNNDMVDVRVLDKILKLLRTVCGHW